MAEKATAEDRFRFLNSINITKQSLIDDPNLRRDYAPYFTNLMLSYHIDTIWHVFQMDKLSNIPEKNQYQYYLNTVRKRKRFTKLHKPTKSDDVSLIQEYFGYNTKRAKEVLPLLSAEQLKQIRQRCNKGGKVND